MEVVIESGISRAELDGFFREKGRFVEKGVYHGAGWRVEMKPVKEYRFKTLPIPRTMVTFTGNDAKVKQLVKEYRKTFLKAGG